MCSGPKSNLCSSKNLSDLESKKEETMGLLEFAACDDLQSFKREVEEKGIDLDVAGLWYCRRVGSKKMGFEERTPLMVAAMYGSKKVLNFIVSTGKADLNRACGDERVTALHCAVAGCSVNMVEVIKSLIDASALVSAVDANGMIPLDVFVRVSRFVASPRRKAVELLLRGGGGLIDEAVEEEEIKIVSSKYPADATLPDINEGVYGSDEFRMYSFKIKPCSRAYSHDWTECAFVHPGENARRRDPRKYPYSCVPCPEFRKGSCPKGDSCEYAHGVFESWLHPAQYKTRLCKDETGCARKVCFFAHKREEMRPVNASTGSAMTGQSPFNSLEMMSSLSPLAYSSGVSTPPVSPMANGVGSSPRNGGSWQNRVNTMSPPALQLNGGSRLKSTLSARDMDIDMEMELRLRSFSNVEETTFGSYVSSPNRNSQMSQNMNQHYPSSPVRQASPHHGFDSSAAVAAAVMNARSSAFAKRSMSFKPASQTASPTNFSDWGSPNGKLEWGMKGEELNKMRRTVSFGIHGNNNNNVARDYSDEPDVSWVNSLVKDNVVSDRGFAMNERVLIMSWAEQMYREKEQTVA